MEDDPAIWVTGQNCAPTPQVDSIKDMLGNGKVLWGKRIVVKLEEIKMVCVRCAIAPRHPIVRSFEDQQEVVLGDGTPHDRDDSMVVDVVCCVAWDKEITLWVLNEFTPYS